MEKIDLTSDRSRGRSCGTCDFWQATFAGRPGAYCVRTSVTRYENIVAEPEDWCGEYVRAPMFEEKTTGEGSE